MRPKVPLLALALAVLAALLPAVPASAAGEATATNAAVAATRTAIDWAPCPDDPTAECGTLAVPVDWADPAGPTIDLALARRKATDPAARIGSLVINPGGPGGSGVDFALFGEEYFSEEIRRRFDIVGFDPRGVARSHPVVCSTDLALQAPDPVLKSQADFDAWLTFNAKLREDCRARTGPLFDHVDTLSVVRDVDALREALGDDKLSYYGVSYGTLIGQLYAERFPKRVRALALDSNMDHSLGTKAFLDTEAIAAQDSFNEFVAWCRRDAGCALHGQNVRAFFADLLARADRGEVHFPDEPDVPLNRLDVISIAFSMFYGPDWSFLAEFLVALREGTWPTGQRSDLAARALSAWSAKKEAKAAGADDEVTEMPTQVFCLDYHLPVRDYREYAGHVRRSALLAPDMRLNPLAFSVLAYCLGQPTPIPNPQHRLKVKDSPTLLLGNALHDPATGYLWALGTALQLGRQGVLLTYEGWGHGIYGRGECTTGAIDAYLVSGTLPRHGARCPAVPPDEVRTLRQARPTPSGPIPNLPGWLSPTGAP